MEQEKNQTHYILFDLSSFLKFDINYLFTALKYSFNETKEPIVQAAYISKYKFTIKDDRQVIENICNKHNIPFFPVNNTDEYIIKKALHLDGIKHVVTNSPSIVSSLISMGDPEHIKFFIEKNAESTIEKLPGLASFSVTILSIIPKKMKYIGSLLSMNTQQLKKARGASLNKEEIAFLKSFFPVDINKLKQIFEETYPHRDISFLANFIYYHCELKRLDKKTIIINSLDSIPEHPLNTVSSSSAEETNMFL